MADDSAFPLLVTVRYQYILLLASSAASPGDLGVLPCFDYGYAHTYCWAGGFLCFLPVICPPLGSWSTGSSGYSSPLGFPTFAMGSPLRGRGSFILNRNEGLVSPFGSGTLVSSWLDLTPLYGAFLCALSFRMCCQVVLAVSMTFGCPWLSPVFFPVPC